MLFSILLFSFIFFTCLFSKILLSLYFNPHARKIVLHSYKEKFFSYIFTFFYMHKKKVLDSRKFWWIYMFWDVLNTIWPFLENICVCTPPKFCGHCISRRNWQKLMKLYIQLHLYGIWSWLDFGAYRSKSSDVIQNFSFL